METIRKKDFIKNEIYTHKNGNIVKYEYLSAFEKISGKHIGKNRNIFQNRGGNFEIKELKLATPEEKHWLETCIIANEFVEYDEAMKTFIPEYYEYIRETCMNFTKNRIYKCLDPNNLEKVHNFIDDKNVPNGWGGLNHKYFKPSTKEAYDAQFAVKKPEFVLPEKWCLKITNDNLQFCRDLKNRELHFPKNYYYTLNGYYSPINCKGSCRFLNIPENYVEITFDQFKKYVLKETIVEKNIEPLPQFKVIETIETITKVENNEGSQFFIGDKVKTTANNIVRTISSFSYNQDKTKLYANFKNTLDICDINNIEHYIEPKVDFILPEKWCIKSKDRKHDNILNSYARSVGATWWDNESNNISRFYMLINNNLYINSCEEKPTTYKEITFEQFEKYVLNKTVEVKEETLLEKAKRLYPAGTKIINAIGSQGITKTNDIYQTINFSNDTIDIYTDQGRYNLYCGTRNKWATIVN